MLIHPLLFPMLPKLFLFIGCVFFLGISEVYPQNRRVARGDLAFELHRYAEAVGHYRRAFSRVRRQDRSEAARISFNTGIAFLRMNNFRQAEVHLKRAIRLNYRNPDVFLQLANVLVINSKHDEARTFYQRFLENAPDDWRGKMGLASLDTAQYLLQNPTDFQVSLFPRFNSRADDLTAAWVDHRAGSLVFASSRDEAVGDLTDPWFNRKHTSLFVSFFDRAGVWSAPALLDEGPLNTEANEGAPATNVRGNELYFTRCIRSIGSDKGCRIWVSRMQGTSWAEPTEVQLVTDSAVTVGHPALSQDELTLYFTSDMPGGLGGKDIWFARRRSPTDSFGRPINLGAPINTPGNEGFPYIREDGALYFSSDGHPGLGALDVFVTFWSPGGWSHPQNLGIPINSPWDDFGVLFFPGENRGFFTSNRQGSRGYDIYSFFLEPLEFTLSGIVRQKVTNESIAGASIQVIGSDGAFLQAVSNPLGRFNFEPGLMLANTQFEIIASKSGFFTSRANLSTVGMEESHAFTMELQLDPIPPDPITLPEILFDFGRWELLPQYRDSLNGLVQTLNENPGLVIELASHTDNRGSHIANDSLSQRRAQSAVEYLILRGINPDRLIAKGYGETKPRTLNRTIIRDGFTFPANIVLSEEFINALPTERHREAAHALNRRTEFRILRDDFAAPTPNRAPPPNTVPQRR